MTARAAAGSPSNSPPDRYPSIPALAITPLHRRPGDAKRRRLVAAVPLPGVVERLAENVLRVRRQMIAHGRRQFIIARIRHGVTRLPIAPSPGNAAESSADPQIATNCLPFVSGPVSSATMYLSAMTTGDQHRDRVNGLPDGCNTMIIASLRALLLASQPKKALDRKVRSAPTQVWADPPLRLKGPPRSVATVPSPAPVAQRSGQSPRSVDRRVHQVRHAVQPRRMPRIG